MNIPRWLEHAAAFFILWCALALLFAPFIGERLKGQAAMTDPRETEPDAPDYQPPEDDPFAELFFDAAREQDEWASLPHIQECGPLSQCAREGHIDSLDHQPGQTEATDD